MQNKKMLQRDLAAELTREIRNFKAPELAAYVLENSRMNELAALALSNDRLLSSRAMWVLSRCSELNYDSIAPYHDTLIKNLAQKNLHKGVIRNTLRLYQNKPAPVKHHVFLLDTCYSYLKNPSEAIAVRAFSITIVFNISKHYPELMHELMEVLNHIQIQEEPAAIRSRVKNTLQHIHKLI